MQDTFQDVEVLPKVLREHRLATVPWIRLQRKLPIYIYIGKPHRLGFNNKSEPARLNRVKTNLKHFVQLSYVMASSSSLDVQ